MSAGLRVKCRLTATGPSRRWGWLTTASRLIALAVLFSWACGDGSPSRLTTASDLPSERLSGFDAGEILTVQSGETGEPVGGAMFEVAGQVSIADDAGRIVLGAAVPEGASVSVTADGFLLRETLARRGQGSFELWPATSPTGLDEAYTRTLVYTSASVGPSMSEALDRPGLDTPMVSLITNPVIEADPDAMANLMAAAAEITDALDGAFVYQVGARPGAIPVTLLVEPDNASIVEDNLRAFTRCWMNRLVIFRCDIVFRSVETVRSETALHELGHTFGLNHSPLRHEIMAVRRSGVPEAFSTRERLVMRMMRKRHPGNLFPDNDRQAPALRALGTVSRILCKHPS